MMMNVAKSKEWQFGKVGRALGVLLKDPDSDFGSSVSKFLDLPTLSLSICKRIIKITTNEILMYECISKL